jgi:hypothetical protein
MTLESIQGSWITGMAIGAQWVEDEFAEDYKLFSYLVVELFIFTLIFEFSKPVTS